VVNHAIGLIGICKRNFFNAPCAEKVLHSLREMFTSPRPYKVKRWVEFLGDVKQEGEAFKQVLKAAADQKERANTAYVRASQRSFNAIHNVTRKQFDESRAVPRLSRPVTRSAGSREPPKLPFEFDVRISNHDRWPRRANATRSSQRVFSPVRLKDYSCLGTPLEKPVICLYGSPLHNFSNVR
jgi:hypothetical protein